MEKHDHVNEDMIEEYRGILDDLLAEYIDNKIDMRTLEIEYRNSTNDIAKKHGIAISHPYTPEYIELDDYGKKVIGKSIGRNFPRTAIQSIIEDDKGTEPGLKIDESSLKSLLVELKSKLKNEKSKV